MVRHGDLKFGFDLEQYEWDEIKQHLAELVSFDPYEPNDWSHGNERF